MILEQFMKPLIRQLGLAVAGAVWLSQSASAQLRITEVMAQASATSSTQNGDWWELTNLGAAPVNLLGYQWADAEDALPSSESNFFPSFVLNPGQSLILLEEDVYSKADWRNMWGLAATVAILTEDEMVDDATPDGDTFSGLGNTGGDMVLFYDPAGNLLDSYTYTGVAFVRGVTFEIKGDGTDLGLSVVGENGAVLAANGDIGSPGLAVVPEPTAFTLLALAGGAFLFPRHRKTAIR
jgi:hypothetical protein